MCTAWLFLQGPTCLHSYSPPINHSWHQKTRDTVLPDGDDRIALRSLVLTQYRSVTDGQTNGFAIASTALAKLALWSAVKILNLAVICQDMIFELCFYVSLYVLLSCYCTYSTF